MSSSSRTDPGLALHPLKCAAVKWQAACLLMIAEVQDEHGFCSLL